MAGELSNVKDKLRQNYVSLFRDRPQLAQQLKQAIDSETIESYKDAFDTNDASEALASAAATGQLGEDYSGVYDRNPELTQALSEAGQDAFTANERQTLQDIAQNTNTSMLYSKCYSGGIDEVVEQLSLDNTPGSASECSQMVSMTTGLADQFGRAYEG